MVQREKDKHWISPLELFCKRDMRIPSQVKLHLRIRGKGGQLKKTWFTLGSMVDKLHTLCILIESRLSYSMDSGLSMKFTKCMPWLSIGMVGMAWTAALTLWNLLLSGNLHSCCSAFLQRMAVCMAGRMQYPSFSFATFVVSIGIRLCICT